MRRSRFVLLILSLLIFAGALAPRGHALADTNITGNITTDTTWTIASSTYVIQNSIVVNSGKTLTIEPGVVVKFKATSTVLYVDGTLNAVGTATSSIYFTSYKDDSVGGNTDGVTVTPQAGNWANIYTRTNATTTLKYVTARYGGSSYALLHNYYGTLTVENSVVATSSQHGIWNYGARTSIATTTINGSALYGVYAPSGGIVSITGSTFYDNKTAAGNFTLGNLTLANSGNTNLAQGAGKRGFIISGTTNANATWRADGLPYIISGGFSVGSGKTLTIDPNTVVKFENSSASIQVNGTLTAVGNSVQPIYFTSIKDDSVGNDTDASATTTPAAGDWKYIIVSSATVNLQYATVRYGGGDGYYAANLVNNGGTYNISTSTISNGYSYGIRHGGGTTNLAQSSLFGNGSKAYYNTTYSTTTATNNYWGDTSGPYNAKYNPGGSGNAVSDYVNFNPWLGQTHYIWPLYGAVDGDMTHPHEIRWDGATQYDTAWSNAINTWNDESDVLIAPDDFFHVEDLTVSDVYDDDVRWTAHYEDYSTPNYPPWTDYIQLNEYFLEDNTDTQRQNTCTHELGHSLLLDHSYIGNVMYFEQTDQTILGTQDYSDYHSLW